MSRKNERISRLLAGCTGQGWDPHYLGYFECFNQGLYFEAHDVLEALWLADRRGPNYAFHKGLIQLAGAFVHLQKERLRPAVVLFDLAAANLARYPDQHDGVSVTVLQQLIGEWRVRVVDAEFRTNPLRHFAPPRLTPPSPPVSGGG